MKGRPLPVAEVLKPPEADQPMVSPEEYERIAGNYRLVKQHMPEFIPFIKELGAVGLIDGPRAIQRVQVFNRKEP